MHCIIPIIIIDHTGLSRGGAGAGRKDRSAASSQQRVSTTMMSNPVVPQLLLPLLLLLLLAAPPAACFVHHHAPSRRLSAPSGAGASSSSSGGDPAAPAADEPAPAVFERWFQGQFDNAAQVAAERAQGMGPGEEGGHEQIHCVLEPLPALRPGSLGGGERFLGATYYFDDKPEAVFRCRVYSFHPPPPTEEDDGSAAGPHAPFAEMRLHRFTPEFEAGLRKGGYDLQALLRPEDVEVDGAGGGALEELEGCSILWAVAEDRRRAQPGGGGGGLLRFRGLMRHGFCEVGSQREAGVRLRIEDELALTAGELAVNDRGFDCATGRLVYGNHRNEPYRMARRRW